MAQSLLSDLIENLRSLPGVGPRTAQRMALHLLERDREGGLRLADSLSASMEGIRRCAQCRNFCEEEHCAICRDGSRDQSTCCVVESPSDVMALEQATDFKGRYFVLLGRLSPLDGIGPEDIGIPLLENQLQDESVSELILATNSTVEGEATAYYLQKLASRHGVAVSRIAHGVPLGGELEYTNQSTLAHAFSSRQVLDNA